MSRLLGWIGAASGGWKSEREIGASDAAWSGGSWGAKSVAGPRVNPDRALCLPAYFAAQRAISEDVGKLSRITYRRLEPRGKERAPRHPAYRLLKSRPNPEMSSMTFHETLTSWALGWGRGPAQIVRDGRGDPRQLWPIHPSRVTPKRDGGELWYDISTDDLGTLPAAERGKPWRLRAEDVLYIHGLGEGWDGYSIAQLAAQSIGTGLAGELQAASYFGNGVRLSGVLEHPGQLGDTALKNLRESLIEPHQDASKAWDVLIAEEGMKFKDAPRISPRDAQALEGRQFQVEDVARWFRIPPHKIGHLARSTNNNIEHQSIEYVQDAILPWVVRWEQEYEAKIFLGDDEHFCEHNLTTLLRGDSKARGELYASGIGNAWLSPDDVRELENMNPIPGGYGSEYYMQGAMVPLRLLAEGQTMPESQNPSAPAAALAAHLGRNGARK